RRRGLRESRGAEIMTTAPMSATGFIAAKTSGRGRRVLLTLFVVGLLIAAAFAQPSNHEALASSDIVLAAMRAELDRSKSQLKMEQVGAPYYIEYRIFDLDQYGAEAAFGALRTDVRSRFRFLRVVVRLGNYKQDSYFGQ